MPRHRLIRGPALLLLAWALPACQTPKPTATVVTADTDAADASGAKPINIKAQREEAEFLEATRGLSFDDGVMRVRTPPASPDLARAAQLIDAGDLALSGNHRTSAIGSYAEAVQSAPRQVDAQLRLARAFVMKGRLEHAIATYRAVVELDASAIDGHIGLANALAAAGRRAEAIDAMEQALRLDPSSGPAHERLAVWTYYEGDIEQSWTHVRAAEAAGQPVPPQLIDLLRRAG